MCCSDGSLEKLVKDSFRQVLCRVQWLHPLVVWECLYRGMSKAMLLDGLPPHMSSELQAMLGAFEQAYGYVITELERQQQETAWDEAQNRLHAFPKPSQAPGSSPRPEISLESVMSATQELRKLSLGCSSSGTGSSNVHSSFQQKQAQKVDQQSDSVAHDPAEVTVLASDGKILEYKALLFASAAFQKAAKAVSGRGDAFRDRSMYRPAASFRKFSFSTDVHMHSVILDCIQPAPDGKLFGYSPSANFAQTWAKRWTHGPQLGRFCPSQSLLEFLPDALLSVVLGSLTSTDFVQASVVCKLWSEVSRSLPDFEARSLVARGRC